VMGKCTVGHRPPAAAPVGVSPTGDNGQFVIKKIIFL
jgi:hypothetical protein